MNKNYTAVVDFTKGWGFERIIFRAESFKEINEKVDNFNGQEFTVAGITRAVRIYKVTFNYPSGKSYTKRF